MSNIGMNLPRTENVYTETMKYLLLRQDRELINTQHSSKIKM